MKNKEKVLQGAKSKLNQFTKTKNIFKSNTNGSTLPT